ncbi:MAG: outer membrane lipoprotein carrier protein LolA [Sandaracinaceae bacterium]
MTLSRTPALCSVLMLALGAGAAQTARAEDAAPSAEVIAAQIQSFYDQTRTVETAFTQSYYDRVYQRTTSARGVLAISRPGKLRFDYFNDGKVVVSNGQTLTVYEPDDDGARGQFVRSPVRSEGIPSALAFLTGQSRLDEDFRFRLADPARFGWDGYVLELRPIRAEAGYARAYLYVDDDPATAGVVRRVLIQDHAGNINRFSFTRMRFNRALDMSRFAFVPPPGAREL